MIEKIELMKTLLEIDTLDTTKDNIFEHYINRALQNVLKYCNVQELPIELDGVIVDYAIYLYKNKDSVGMVKKTQGDRGVTYETGIPESIKAALPLPKIKVV